MLRPATPLSVIFLVAFVLELLSTLSTPIIKAIPLASFQGYDFGVFGWCQGSTCSKIAVGYGTDSIFSSDKTGDFTLPSATRHSLSSILIVHPVSAFLTLVCFGLAVATHFHSPSSSPRYLLALLILTIPTLLITLLAFLVDILLFVPHMSWGGWIMLGATILIIASSVMTCAMRRTLVSRKARKKRIAENAEMSGENYYLNLAENRMVTDSQLPRADSPPPMSANAGMDKAVPSYAAFEMGRQDTSSLSRDGDPGIVDDRQPLNPSSRDPSVRSRSMSAGRPGYANSEMAPIPIDGRPSMDSQGRPRRPSRDQYGNAIPPMPMRGRGRGGYGPPPRGYGQPRGGYGPPREAYRGGPPPGWSGRGRGYGPSSGMRGTPPGRSVPPPGYGNDAYFAGGAAVAGGVAGGMAGAMHSQSPTDQRYHDPYVAGSDAPIGQAIEMDERTGTASGPVSPGPNQGGFAPNYGLRDSDADVSGMVGLQQGRMDGGGPVRMDSDRSNGPPRSPTSIYSEQQYVPPRQQWQQPAQDRQYNTSPLAMDAYNASHAHSSGAVSSLHGAQVPPIDTSQSALDGPRHQRAGSEPYYEDVDPRFAVEEPSDDGYNRDSALPTALTPGGHINPGGLTPGQMVNETVPGGFPITPGSQNSYGFPNRTQAPQHNPSYLHPTYGGPTNDSHSGDAPSLEQDPSLETMHESTGSERASEASHFTSISERPVNPNWRPSSQTGGSYVGGSSASAVQSRRQDAILTSNPDFSLPGGRGGGRARGNSRGATATSNLGGGLTPMGRYPTDV